MIEILNYARAAGKTTAAVDIALTLNQQIMVFDQREKKRLLTTYPKLQEDQVFTIEEIQRRKGKRKYNGTVIDNLDIILRHLLDTDVTAVTLTEPVKLIDRR